MDEEQEKKIKANVYLTPRLKKWLELQKVMEGCRLQDIIEEGLTIYMKWAKKAEILERKEKKLDTSEAEAELVELDKHLDETIATKKGRYPAHAE